MGRGQGMYGGLSESLAEILCAKKDAVGVERWILWQSADLQ